MMSATQQLVVQCCFKSCTGCQFLLKRDVTGLKNKKTVSFRFQCSHLDVLYPSHVHPGLRLVGFELHGQFVALVGGKKPTKQNINSLVTCHILPLKYCSERNIQDIKRFTLFSTCMNNVDLWRHSNHWVSHLSWLKLVQAPLSVQTRNSLLFVHTFYFTLTLKDGLNIVKATLTCSVIYMYVRDTKKVVDAVKTILGSFFLFFN